MRHFLAALVVLGLWFALSASARADEFVYTATGTLGNGSTVSGPEDPLGLNGSRAVLTVTIDTSITPSFNDFTTTGSQFFATRYPASSASLVLSGTTGGANDGTFGATSNSLDLETSFPPAAPFDLMSVSGDFTVGGLDLLAGFQVPFAKGFIPGSAPPGPLTPVTFGPGDFTNPKGQVTTPGVPLGPPVVYFMTGVTFQVETVPEPSSLLLLATGLLGLGLLARRRVRAA